MKQYLMRHEPNKGYIISDKIRIAGKSFESFSFYHIEELKNKMEILKNKYKLDIYMSIYEKDMYKYGFKNITEEFLVLNGYSSTEDYNGNVFYFNLNHDCIQVFINRSFESK